MAPQLATQPGLPLPLSPSIPWRKCSPKRKPASAWAEVRCCVWFRCMARLGQSTLSSSSRACCNKCSRKPQLRVVQLNTGNNGHRSSRAQRQRQKRQQSRGNGSSSSSRLEPQAEDTRHRQPEWKGVGSKHSLQHLDLCKTLFPIRAKSNLPKG